MRVARRGDLRLISGVAVVLAGLVSCQRSQDTATAHAPADTVRMTRIWAIEPGLSPLADSLGEVSGVARDSRGNVYISDFQASRLWIVDAAGRFLRSLGEKGDGPGEFQEPTGPAVGPDDRLYVRDVYRVSVFGRDSTGLLTVPDQTFSGPVYPDWTSKRATRFDTAGGLLYPGQKWLKGGTSAPYFIRFGRDGTMGDTTWVPSQPTARQLTALVRTNPGGGRLVRGLNYVPFSPLPVWDITSAGRVISGDGRDYRLVETAKDTTTLVVFERRVGKAEVPSAQRTDSVEALKKRIESLEVARDRIEGVPDEVWSLDVPTVFPAVQAVCVAEDQTVWVRRWPPDGGDRTIFDVFTSDGQYDHTVLLDREIAVEPTPVLTANSVTGVAQSPTTDEWIVIQFEMAHTR